MPREIEEPTHNQYGDDTHPAFGAVKVSRIQHSPPGTVLFDSDVRHQHYIKVTLSRMTRKRNLKTDWLHPTKELFEVDMSESQWAAFVSSVGSGTGVPCTIRSTETDWHVPGLPYTSRLALSAAETRDAAKEAFDEITEAMAAYDSLDSKAPAKEKREALRRLRSAIANAPANVEHASKSLTEHTENVVQKARADIEAMVTNRAQQLGLTAEQAETLAIESRNI
jgi:hypothetical protein